MPLFVAFPYLLFPSFSLVLPFPVSFVPSRIFLISFGHNLFCASGGKRKRIDGDAKATALRELAEETAGMDYLALRTDHCILIPFIYHKKYNKLRGDRQRHPTNGRS